MGLWGPMLRRSTDPISALTGCHAPARGAGRTAHAPGSPTPPLDPLGPQERVRETGEGRAARRLQSRQRHCVASAGGVPARPPAPAPAHAAPAGSRCAALLLLLLDGSPRVLVDGSAAWSRGRSPAAATLPPSLRRLNRVSGVEGGGAKWVWCATRPPPLPAPLTLPLPPFAALPPPRAAVGAACWASMLSLLGTGTWNARYMFERPPGFKQKIVQALSQPLRPPGTRGRRGGALGGPF